MGAAPRRTTPAPRLLFLVCACTFLGGRLGELGGQGAAASATSAQESAAEQCDKAGFGAVYDNIKADLQIWQEAGISKELMTNLVQDFPQRPLASKGVGILFQVRL